MKLLFPFIGREREMARLRQLHKQRRHVLILGAEGTGKSALVEQLREPLELRVCPAFLRLGEICENLEREFHLTGDGGFLLQAKIVC